MSDRDQSVRSGWQWDVPGKPFLDWFWRVTMCWSICVEGTVTWFSADDNHQRERKIDWELGVPRVLWRPYCWLRGKHDEYYGSCVFCETPLRERSDD